MAAFYPAADEAMEELCRLYWYPLYAYIRRRGHECIEAEDLTQEFFLRLLAKEFSAGMDRRKGQVPRLLAGRAEALPGQPMGPLPSPKTRRRERCNLTGWPQGRKPLSLEPAHNLTRKNSSSGDGRSPSSTRSCSGCKPNLDPRGQTSDLRAVETFLTAARQPGGYAEAAVELGMTEGAVKTAVQQASPPIPSIVPRRNRPNRRRSGGNRRRNSAFTGLL